MSATAIFPPADYLAANENAAIYPIPNPGYLLISGETRHEYLQRQTTNDIDLLSPTRVLPTMLTAPTGRILEYYILLGDGDSIAILTQPGHGPGNAAYFQKRIFFNDKVTIQDQSSDWMQIELLGPQTPELLTKFGLGVPALNEVQTTERQYSGLRVIGQLGFGVSPRYRLVAPASQFEYLTKQLSDYHSLSYESREILRIEASHAGDPEIAAGATPFEIGMDHLVSTTKGCYTGQEVLARQVTYDKVVRRLVQLASNELLLPGTALEAEGKTVGQVTSSANSPRLGPIALAIVRKPYDETKTSLRAISGEQELVSIVT